MYQTHFIKIRILSDDYEVVINGILANDTIIDTLPRPIKAT